MVTPETLARHEAVAEAAQAVGKKAMSSAVVEHAELSFQRIVRILVTTT